MGSASKLRSLEELAALSARLKSEGKRVVMANGCFDIIHVGHVRYLEAARRLGDVLVVAINSDGSTRALKGRGRPIVGARERAEIVGALECVDYCFVFEELTLDDSIRRLRPNVHAKGTDYTKENVPERSTVLEVGGRVEIVGDDKNHSTKDMVELILNRFSASP
jgi:rfaE bifunctional protein nucleotidyltransferase chain/domain